MTKQSVITEALKLAEADRLDIVDALYESLEGHADPEVEQAWADEIAERLRSIDAGEVILLHWDDVQKSLREPGHGAADHTENEWK